jgi:hypothetical protein
MARSSAAAKLMRKNATALDKDEEEFVENFDANGA